MYLGGRGSIYSIFELVFVCFGMGRMKGKFFGLVDIRFFKE